MFLVPSFPFCLVHTFWVAGRTHLKPVSVTPPPPPACYVILCGWLGSKHQLTNIFASSPSPAHCLYTSLFFNSLLLPVCSRLSVPFLFLLCVTDWLTLLRVRQTVQAMYDRTKHELVNKLHTCWRMLIYRVLRCSSRFAFYCSQFTTSLSPFTYEDRRNLLESYCSLLSALTDFVIVLLLRSVRILVGEILC